MKAIRLSTIIAEITAIFGLAVAGMPALASDPRLGAPVLVADLTPGSEASEPTHFAATGKVAFFRLAATSELWRTDGTAAGTFPLGVTAARLSPTAPQFALGWSKRRLFLLAWDPEYEYGRNLWASDGTVAGTVQLTRDLEFGSANAGWPSAWFIEARGRLFFRAADAEHGSELWVSNGTPAGTRLLADLAPGPVGSDPMYLQEFGGRLFFFAGAVTGDEVWLWRSDGTAAGTVRVAGPFPRLPLSGMAEVGGRLFFLAQAETGVTLWVTDGTTAGTRMVVSVPAARLSWDPKAAKSRLYFPLWTAEHDEELWVSDGTAAGTMRLTDFEQPYAFAYAFRAHAVQDSLIFTYFRNPAGEVWMTGGTPASTRPLDLCGEGCTAAWTFGYGDFAIFAADEPVHGRELWRTDGTRAGTRLIADVCPGPCGSDPGAPILLGELLLFIANDGETGHQFWWTDGRSGQATRLTHFPSPQWWGNRFEGARLADRYIFAADDGLHGREPWVLEFKDTSPCTPGTDRLCLNGGRFEVTATYLTPQGQAGSGQAVPLTGDSGYFWFFNADNVEVVLKVLDACSLPASPRFWVFAAGLTNVEVVLRVRDTATGEVREYRNPLGRAFEPLQDTRAFETCAAAAAGPQPRLWRALGSPPEASEEAGGGEPPLAVAAVPTVPRSGSCQPTDTGLCLQGGRFRVEATWRTARGSSGSGRAVPLTEDTGTFWFFSPDNLEVIVKVLDACSHQALPRFWVFAAGLTNVEVVLRVTDTVADEVREYRNPLHSPFLPLQDTGAFPTCP